MKQLTLLAIVSAIFVPCLSHGQDKPKEVDFKYGKVAKEDFQLPADAIEPDAAAYIICDKGYTEFVGNVKGWFSLNFTRKVRIKITNNNGIDAADFLIPLYRDGDAIERLPVLKAVAHNLEGETITHTELKSDQIFIDKKSKNLEFKKFSVPGAKAGSLIDVTYTIESDFLRNLQPWIFQGEYPRYWSEYEVAFPSFFNYVTLSQGYHNFLIKTNKESSTTFRITFPSTGGVGSRAETETLSATLARNRWVMHNVPALKVEPFTTSLRNHIAKIEFQLNQYRFEGQPNRDIMAQWPQVVKALNETEEFGAGLYKGNNWLDDENAAATAGAQSTLEKATKLYNHLRDKYTCNSGGMYMGSNLKNVVKTRSGNVADINLLLVAMLNHEKIEASPVILSTRDHGWTHEFYPLMDRFNYVVVHTKVDDKEYYLDATEPGLPFGILPPQCYNGHARVIKDFGMPVYFLPDSISEKTLTFVQMNANEKGELVGQYASRLGNYGTLEMRQEAKEKGVAAQKESIRKGVGSEFTVSEVVLENIDSANKNIEIKYEAALPLDKEADVLYINPMLGPTFKENPFKTAERLYPVEMPYTLNDTYVVNIDIPDGYEVDELPKSTRVNLYESDGMFEYMINANAEARTISMRCRLLINRADFAAEDYEALRDFFAYVVKKQGETIVLKKKAK